MVLVVRLRDDGLLCAAAMYLFFFSWLEIGFASPTDLSTSAFLPISASHPASSLSFCPCIFGLITRSKLSTTTTSSTDDLQARLLRHRALGCYHVAPYYYCSAAACSPHLLVVAALRGAPSSAWPHYRWTSGRCIDMRLQLCVSSDHSLVAFIIFIAARTSTPLSSALIIFSHRVILRLLQASPPRLQVAIIAALGRWSNYPYMAIGVVVQAVGSATSSSSSCNMPHRQRRRIFLDYTSFFSGKCMLLRQFYPSTLFSCRRLSLLVSRYIIIKY